MNNQQEQFQRTHTTNTNILNEIVQKAISASLPLIAAVGAPSSLAIELAERFNLTLVGFLRPDAAGATASVGGFFRAGTSVPQVRGVKLWRSGRHRPSFVGGQGAVVA